MHRQFQSTQGPTDPGLRHSEIEGYQPVSRIGEIVINSFIDAYEFAALPTHVTHGELMGLTDITEADVEASKKKSEDAPAGAEKKKLEAEYAKMKADKEEFKGNTQIEQKPHFHEVGLTLTPTPTLTTTPTPTLTLNSGRPRCRA